VKKGNNAEQYKKETDSLLTEPNNDQALTIVANQRDQYTLVNFGKSGRKRDEVDSYWLLQADERPELLFRDVGNDGAGVEFLGTGQSEHVYTCVGSGWFWGNQRASVPAQQTLSQSLLVTEETLLALMLMRRVLTLGVWGTSRFSQQNKERDALAREQRWMREQNEREEGSRTKNIEGCLCARGWWVPSRRRQVEEKEKRAHTLKVRDRRGPKDFRDRSEKRWEKGRLGCAPNLDDSEALVISLKVTCRVEVWCRRRKRWETRFGRMFFSRLGERGRQRTYPNP
jgi:hypothetical protein